MLVFVEIDKSKSKDGHIKWLCKCECGNISSYIATRVRHNRVNNCKQCAIKIGTSKIKKHGMKNSPTYSSWSAAKRRSMCKTSKDFNNYGAKGITFCERWLNFENFLQDMGIRPIGTSLDRIDGSKGYEPGNCRWATPTEQARNRKDFTFVKVNEVKIALVDYAKQIGISKGAAHLRLKRGKLDGATNV